MSYLVCDKCGGYYELQPDESPDDFSDKCECGGNLRYVQDLDEVCPNCGLELKESPLTEKQLIFGFLFFLFNLSIIMTMAIFSVWALWMSIVISIFKPQPGLSIYSVIGLNLFFAIIAFCLVMAVIALIKIFKSKYLIMYEKSNLNWVAIAIAFVFAFYLRNDLGFIGPLIGGFIAGCIVGKSYTDGLVNGGFPAGIGGFISIVIFTSSFGGNAGTSSDIILSGTLIIAILYSMAFFIVGSIGGILGAGIRKKISN